MDTAGTIENPDEKEQRMKCPVDDAVLVMSERSGVEIDYCPTCRGVWLDRGELDKILDRAAQDLESRRPDPAPPAATPPAAAPPPERTARPAQPSAPPPEPTRSHYGGPFDDAPVPPPPPQHGYPAQPGYPPRRGFFFGSGPSAPSPEDYYRGGYGRPRRRRSFLDDLFD